MNLGMTQGLGASPLVKRDTKVGTGYAKWLPSTVNKSPFEVRAAFTDTVNNTIPIFVARDSIGNAKFTVMSDGTINANAGGNQNLSNLRISGAVVVSFVNSGYQFGDGNTKMAIASPAIIGIGGANPYTSSFPAMKRSGTTVTFRLGDDSADCGITASTGAFSDNISTTAVGKTLLVKSGTNAKSGTFTLVAGTATVSNTSVTANSVIMITLKTVGGTRTADPDIVPTATTGFVATGGVADTSTYNFVILEVN